LRTLHSYLEAAPKTLLRELHTRFLGKRGLLNNSQILGEVCGHLQDAGRLQKWISELEPWQLRTMRFIYLSGSRGIEAHELIAGLASAHRNSLPGFLLGAAEQMLLWRSKNGTSFVYHGFSDFSVFFPPDAPALPDSAGLRWYGNSGMLEWHLMLMLALAQLGRLRLNASGDLHRRSSQLCEEAFRYGAQLSPAVPADELLLVMQFALDKEWLCLQDGELRPTRQAMDFLRRSGFRLRSEILQWWITRRFSGDADHLRLLLATCEKGSISARCAGELFWPLDPASRPFADETTLGWDSEPRPLRELWLLGLVEATTEQGRLSRFKLSAAGNDWMSGQVSLPPGTHHACLPNFEMILSVSNGPLRLFQTACLARVENDEPVLRFTLAREVFLDGLRSNMPQGFDEEFLQWCGAPPSLLETLKEWHSVHSGADIRTLRVLRIKDPAKLAELDGFDRFVELTQERIPGWGFVLKEGHDAQVREILKHFGLEPPPDPSFSESKTLRQAEWTRQFQLPWPAQGETDFDFKPGPNREAMASAMGATKYSTEFQQLDQNKLLQVLRYAHVTETPLEAMVRDPSDRKAQERTLAFTIQRLQVRREPFHLEAQLSPGREVLEIPFLHIQKIRLQSI